jgi:hypothetical protein
MHLMRSILSPQRQQAPKHVMNRFYTLRPTLYRLRNDLRIVDMVAAVQLLSIFQES